MDFIGFSWTDASGRVRSYALPEGETRIGRRTDCDIVVAGADISRLHATVIRRGDSCVLRDAESAFGTRIGAESISERRLRNGDVVTLGRGGVSLRFVEGASPDTREGSSRRLVDALVHPTASFVDLPDASDSELQKIVRILDFQKTWGEVFTPESAFRQVLDSSLSVSGAERGFILTREDSGYHYAAGLIEGNQPLAESEFTGSRSVVRRVLDTHQPVFMIEGLDPDFLSKESIIAQGLRAVACIPLIGLSAEGGGELLGVLYLDSRKAMHAMTGLDERMLRKLAVDAGHVLERIESLRSIEQRRRLEEELTRAQEVQRSLVPEVLPVFDHVEVFGFSRPTRFVSGDFYDVHRRHDGAAIAVLGDVSGKGAAASLLSAMLLGCLQLEFRSGRSLSDAVSDLNRLLCDRPTMKFATMFLCVVEPGGLGHYVSAGHNSALIYRAGNGKAETLESNGMLVGAFDGAEFPSTTFLMGPGDILVAFSDGLTEAENAQLTQFGEAEVRRLVEENGSGGGYRLQSCLIEAVTRFAGNHPQSDDITLITLAAR